MGERLTHAELLWQGLSNPLRPALFETHIKLGRERKKRGLYLREAEKLADWEKGSESERWGAGGGGRRTLHLRSRMKRSWLYSWSTAWWGVG